MFNFERTPAFLDNTTDYNVSLDKDSFIYSQIQDQEHRRLDL